ncbi:MAG: ABC transporter substrate-binding protein [Myxococcota bacterium]
MRRPSPLLTLAAAVAVLASASPGLAESPALRVATLVPFVDDAMAGLPSDRISVVATVRRSMRHPVREGVLDLGNPHSPDLEQLMLARADLVIGDSVVHAPRAEALARGGAEVLLIDTTRVDSALDGLVEVANRAGLGDEMGRRVEQAKTRLTGLRLEAPVRSMTVFAVPGKAMLVTPRSWIGDLLGRLGFVDVAGSLELDEHPGGFVEISDEIVAGLQPDWLLIVAHGAPDAVEKAFRRQLAEGGAWASVASSTRGRVRVLAPRYFSANPGLGMPEAARWLVEAIENDAAPVAESAAR